MTERTQLLAVAIDTASDTAGVALTLNGVLLVEMTWHAKQSHSRDLLPVLDWLLGRTGRRKEDPGAVFVCLGPGSYAGLRVGVSTAKTLAFALEIPIAGVGRLEAAALPLAAATARRVVPVQAAGRAELAWAIYQHDGTRMQELSPPGLGPAEELVDVAHAGDLIVGDVDRLDAQTSEALLSKECRLLPEPASRVSAIAALGHQRLEEGRIDNPDTLVPLYLRAPAIGPQPPR
jgi:tRNA threonylcarbamoyl adenosine modification protein YeaZ